MENSMNKNKSPAIKIQEIDAELMKRMSMGKKKLKKAVMENSYGKRSKYYNKGGYVITGR